MSTLAALSTNQKREAAGQPGPPFVATSADNGLSVDPITGRIVWGNDDTGGTATGLAKLLSDREIDTDGGKQMRLFDATAPNLIQTILSSNFIRTTDLAANRETDTTASRTTIKDTLNNQNTVLEPAGISMDAAPFFSLLNTQFFRTLNNVSSDNTEFGLHYVSFTNGTTPALNMAINYNTAGSVDIGDAQATNILRAQVGYDVTMGDIDNFASGFKMLVSGSASVLTVNRFGLSSLVVDQAASTIITMGDVLGTAGQTKFVVDDNAQEGRLIAAGGLFVEDGGGNMVNTTGAGLIITNAASEVANLQVVAGAIFSVSANGGLRVTGSNNYVASGTTLSNNAGAAAGTLTNAPTAGNPAKWIAFDDNGTIRKIPTWL